jgi:hypothetical protein
MRTHEIISGTLLQPTSVATHPSWRAYPPLNLGVGGRCYTAGKFDRPVPVRYRVDRRHAGAVERDVTFGPENCVVGPVEQTSAPDLTVTSVGRAD